MIQAVIVDDEFNSRESLRLLLENFVSNVKIVALCETIADAVSAIHKHRPDLVFLDIQLHRETGFDLFAKIPQIDFEVIFTTAFSEHAIKAIKFSAIDYLLKPIDIEDLKMAVSRVEKRMEVNAASRVNDLIRNLKNSPNENFKIALPTQNGLTFVKVNEIIYCVGSQNYTELFTSDGKKYLVSKTLKVYEELLSKHNFFRIHISYLVNLDAVKRYVKGEGGHVILSNDVSLDVSKRRKEALLEKLGVS